MGWTMSDDYAAISTTVILAVLLIGTVQAYTLVKSLDDHAIPLSDDVEASLNRAVRASRTGEPFDDADLDALMTWKQELLARQWRAAGYMVAAMVWVLMCAVLLIAQVRVLRWAGTHTPKDDPELARFVFVVCSVAIALLTLEGLARIIIRLLDQERRYRAQRAGTGLEGGEAVHIIEALEAYKAARQPSSDPQPPS